MISCSLYRYFVLRRRYCSTAWGRMEIAVLTLLRLLFRIRVRNGAVRGDLRLSSKYQREIEEILQNAGDIGGGGRRSKRPSSNNNVGFFRLVWMYVKQSLGGRFWSISPGRVMLVGFVLILSTLLVRPFVGGVAGWLGWAGLLMFIMSATGWCWSDRPRCRRSGAASRLKTILLGSTRFGGRSADGKDRGTSFSVPGGRWGGRS